MSQIIGIIKKPIDAIEKKFDGKVQKALIYLGIIVGVLLVADLLSTMYSTLMASKSFWNNNKIDWNSLKDINYLKFILTFILRQIFLFGSLFAGIFVYTSIAGKKFNLLETLSIIVVGYTANYLLTAGLDIIFMFKFMDVKFLVAIERALLALTDCYSIILIAFGLQKTYSTKINDKEILNLVIMFGVTYVINSLLLLTI